MSKLKKRVKQNTSRIEELDERISILEKEKKAIIEKEKKLFTEPNLQIMRGIASLAIGDKMTVQQQAEVFGICYNYVYTCRRAAKQYIGHVE